jgi:DNA-binding MarR family transcriptional regulator
MADDLELRDLGEALVRTTTRAVRWLPTEGLEHSLATIRIMARLSDNGPSRITDLAELERSSQPTITNHVKRLEGLGFVRRSKDPHDARSSLIELSPAGREQLVDVRQRLGTNLQPHLAHLTTQDRRTLAAGLRVLQRLMTEA